ncbi:MAG: hypothetical protein EZS28_013801 [Streblomastix strix]|uniref:Cyclin N-terminal domain-containing protein n=1 Tax=Streblomastix strix TaxID=222440 RepID=A0A5J4W6Y3_9EUKA|nr:MAG: hypothetical protein EZS28_013801 [Streblomastix strix]
MTLAELVYAAWMVIRFCTVDQKRIQAQRAALEENAGTILLCAICITQKLLREFDQWKNSQWIQIFDVDIKCLNTSEISFLQRVDYKVWMDKDSFISTINSMLGEQELEKDLGFELRRIKDFRRENEQQKQDNQIKSDQINSSQKLEGK